VPELPEVETIVRDLRPRLEGRRIAAVEVSKQSLRKRWRPAWGKALIGRTIREISRRGKWIRVHLDGDFQLIMHLGMTGQLTALAAVSTMLPHTHLVFTLDRGREQLRFRDIRRFGSATLFASSEQAERFFQESQLGPEPFDVRADYWRQRLASTRRCLKAALLDQRLVAGIGNIYADESLFEARLHPARLGAALRFPEAQRLRQAVVDVLHRAIEKRGSSIRDYVGGSGLKGEFQEEFRVYRRTGQPCLRCTAPIARIQLAGRSTHFCSRCQPAD
jgi:formamidopyrimidine-DNA glycosylase